MTTAKSTATTHTHASKRDANAAAGNTILDDLAASPPAASPPAGASPPAASPPAGTSPPAATAPAAHPGDRGAPEHLVDFPPPEIVAAVQQSLAALATVRKLLPNPARLTQADRRTIGRLRDGESTVLQSVADVAAMVEYAPLVASLADRDNGDDPDAFEPALLKHRLENVDALTPLVDALESLAQDMSDTVLALQALARQPLLDAYAILKAVAKSNPTLKALLKDAIDYYASIAKAGVKTKKAKAAAAATSATTTASASSAPAAKA
jgi:hypothetical protein